MPLEHVLRRRGQQPKLEIVKLERPAPPPPPPPEAPLPRRFKVVDVMTRETLVEDADMRTTAEVLGEVRSIVDIHVFVWDQPHHRWRALGLDEQRTLWGFRAPRVTVSNTA